MKRLMLAAVILVLSGCSTTPVAVSNPAPAPWFPSCETVAWLRDNGATDTVISDMVRMTNVMLKLRTLQPEEQREKLGKCPATLLIPGNAGKSIS